MSVASAERLDIAIDVACATWRGAVAGVEEACRRAARAAYDGAAAARTIPPSLALPRKGGGKARSPSPSTGEGGGGGECEVSIVLADDDFVRGLNRDWRGRDAATNVLAFANGDAGAAPAAPGAPRMLGDIAIAYQTAAAEAAAGGIALGDHLSHLVVHGMLHLLGHDHSTNEEAERMERLEARVLSGLGVADPYARAAPAYDDH